MVLMTGKQESEYGITLSLTFPKLHLSILQQ